VLHSIAATGKHTIAPNNSSPCIEMKGIVKDFPGVRALDHVDFQVRDGEIMGLVGENGAGKSTLVKILSGAYQKDAGSILIHGHEAHITDPTSALRLGICVIYQEVDLVPVLTVKENIFLGHMMTHGGLLDMQGMARQARELLHELGFDIDPNIRLGQLSIAQQQIVAIAKALSRRVKVLVLDEPAAVIPEKDLVTLFALLRRLAQQGIAVVYISHRLKEVLSISDRITVLKDGRLVGVIPTSEASENLLTKMVVGRSFKDYFPKRQNQIGEQVFQVDNLATEYIRDIDLSLHKGEILGIYGLVGSGRTELAKALFGIVPKTSGRIIIEGQEVTIRNPRDAIALGLGLLTEDRRGEGLVLNASVSANITMASYRAISRAGWINFQQEREIARRYADALRIKTPSLRTIVSTLSGGNQQKVILAKWLCTQAKILIFDEPTRGIDVSAKAEIYQLMTELVNHGVGIILISSELHEILGMCDRVMVMYDGSISQAIDKKQASEEVLVAMAMGGDKHDAIQ